MSKRTTRASAAAAAADSSFSSPAPGVDVATSSPASSSAAPSNPTADKQQTLLSAETGHFSLIRALHLADLITELNGFCGIMSVFSSLRYCLGDPADTGNLYLALAFLPFGMFFDFMDGTVARWRKKSSLMGQELDSLADLVRSLLSSLPRPIFCTL